VVAESPGLARDVPGSATRHNGAVSTVATSSNNAGDSRTTLLCIDVRNQRTTFGIFDGADLADTWRVSTDARRTPDEWALVFSGLIDPDDLGALDGICVSSTVPAVLHSLRSMLAATFDGVDSVVVGPGVKSGIPVLMDNPREVGTDRVANAAGAAARVGGPCIVVDFETATTFDVVDGEGRYVGGAIAPGVETSLDALRQRAVQLRQVELEVPRTVIAKNTTEALQAGTLYGFAGLVDRIVDEMIVQLGVDAADCTVVATGVLDLSVVQRCRTVSRTEPYLTLHGLRLIFERNQP